MERGFGVKDRHGKLGRESRVEHHAGVELLLEADVTLNGKERADAFFGEVDDCVGEALEEIELAFAIEREEAVAAEAGKAIAKFWLENHDQRKSQYGSRAGDDPLDHLEFEEGGNQREENQNRDQPHQDLGAARGPEGPVNLIDASREEKDLNAITPMRYEEFHHGFSSKTLNGPANSWQPPNSAKNGKIYNRFFT